MNILFDENIPAVERFFGSLGQLRSRPGSAISASDLQDVDVLLVRSVTPVDRALLAASPVRFVGSCTAGVDHIDLDYLTESGIAFAYAPGANARSVVEYVLSALCYLSRQQRRVEPGMSVGIVGLGNVGARLYRLLDALGFECAGYDPLISVPSEINHKTSLDQVLCADIISLHVPLTRRAVHGTYHLLNTARLATLPKGAILINSARGSVIDNRALEQLLRQRHDLGVVLDVWEHEPAINLSLLAQVDLATPHIAGYSYDGKLRGTEMVCQGLCRYLRVEPPARIAVEECGDPLLAMPGWDALCEKILSVYDISGDDRRMRDRLVDEVAAAGEFEGLRRQYPVRREVACGL